jgi:hypothetical protein
LLNHRGEGFYFVISKRVKYKAREPRWNGTC